MIDLSKIHKAQSAYIDRIEADLKRHHFSYEILDYISLFANIEIDSVPFSKWNRYSYEAMLRMCRERNSVFICIQFGMVYRYINPFGLEQLNHSLDDDEKDCDISVYLSWEGKEDLYKEEYFEYNFLDLVVNYC